MVQREIAVAGCGPAGLAAALFLHRAGNRVFLFDQFPDPRPIGSGLMLQPTGLAVLDALGLGADIRRRSAPITRMVGRVVPSGRTVLDVTYDPSGQQRCGFAIHRSALFDVLYPAVMGAGIHVAFPHRITELVSSSGGRISLLDHKCISHGPFDLVINAGGLRSPLSADMRQKAGLKELPFGALWASLAWPAGPFRQGQLEQRYRKADRMVGVLPLGRPDPGEPEQAAFFWSLPVHSHETWLAAGLAHWKDEVRSIWPETDVLLAQIQDPEQLTMARYYHVTLLRPYGAAVAHIGDSAHATSPQLGQGANMALLDAAALAVALDEYPDVEQALQRYAQIRRWHVLLYQAISYVFTPFYQSASALLPVLRDHVLWPLSRIPPGPQLLSRLVRGQLVDQLGVLGLDRAMGMGERVSPSEAQ